VIRNSELWGGLFWLGIGGYVVWAGHDMGLGRLNEPGSGGPTLASLWEGTRWRKVALVVGLLLVYGVVFERIGFIPCTLALLLILMWFVDPVRWWLAIIIAFAATFGVWAALTKWLKIQLPSGILNGIL
jgi:putative tricarboxylic transport membrane protein